MTIDSALLITTFVTLFVVIDPLALAPLFLALTRGKPARVRRAIAVRASLTAIGVLTVFGAFGEAVLNFAGISMPAFRVAGGLLLFLTALEMLFERRTKRREHQAEGADDDDGQDDHDPSVFPLAIPLIAGPGAIASMILLAGQNPGPEGLAVVVAVMVVVVTLSMVSFMVSDLMERVLGKTGINVITRLLGMLLAALAVQFVLDGLRDFGFAG